MTILQKHALPFSLGGRASWCHESSRALEGRGNVHIRAYKDGLTTSCYTRTPFYVSECFHVLLSTHIKTSSMRSQYEITTILKQAKLECTKISEDEHTRGNEQLCVAWSVPLSTVCYVYIRNISTNLRRMCVPTAGYCTRERQFLSYVNSR